MSSALPTTLDQDEILVAELRRLGVRHLARLAVTPPTEPLQPEELLRALAGHEQARFQAALIPLFLRRPEFSAHVPARSKSCLARRRTRSGCTTRPRFTSSANWSQN